MELLLEDQDSERTGFRHTAVRPEARSLELKARTSHEKWVINKIRALMSWYSKGLHNGGHLRTSINAATSIDQVRDIIQQFFSIAETVTSR